MLDFCGFFVTYGRSPCGERGLKYRKLQVLAERENRSLPVRGAWVEMRRISMRVCEAVSLPVRGAWVEIDARSPPRHPRRVAPRAGSVG